MRSVKSITVAIALAIIASLFTVPVLGQSTASVNPAKHITLLAERRACRVKPPNRQSRNVGPRAQPMLNRIGAEYSTTGAACNAAHDIPVIPDYKAGRLVAAVGGLP